MTTPTTGAIAGTARVAGRSIHNAPGTRTAKSKATPAATVDFGAGAVAAWGGELARRAGGADEMTIVAGGATVGEAVGAAEGGTGLAGRGGVDEVVGSGGGLGDVFACGPAAADAAATPELAAI